MTRLDEDHVTRDYALHVLFRDGRRVRSGIEAEDITEAALFGANRASDMCRTSQKELISISIFPVYEAE